jgi:hypothetical protein
MNAAAYCDHCGEPLPPAGSAAAPGERSQRPRHEACPAARAREPPRYCARCGRRTVVKVTPTAWSSHCRYHGLTTGTS